MTRFPWRLAGYVVAAVLALAALNHFAGYIPFTPQWSAKRAEAKADRLEGQVTTLEREAEGNAEVTKATETFHTRETIIREIASQAEIQARTAPDAETPLHPDRVDRLRVANDRLCAAYPAICPPPDAP